MEEATDARPGEEIDAASLAEYLAGESGTLGRRLEIQQFPAGSSNLTYLVRSGPEEFVLRRPPFGNTVRSAHDMRREFDVLTKLSSVYRPAPKPLLFCDDESVIGSEFYLMERRHGLIVRGRARPGVQAASSGQARLETSRQYRLHVCRSFISNLADLHALDYVAAGLGDMGKPDGYNRRQVEGWTRRYFAARTDEHPELESAIQWLERNTPPESAAALIHNDYKFDNVMLDPEDLTRVTAVLDWEMVTIGDPLMDLGTTLAYWMSKDSPDWLLNMPFNPRVLMENISRRDLVEMYAEAQGHIVPDMLFYYAFGTFKIAVICQQIYARYVKGFTKDQRFAGFDKFVGELGRIAGNAIDKKSI